MPATLKRSRPPGDGVFGCRCWRVKDLTETRPRWTAGTANPPPSRDRKKRRGWLPGCLLPTLLALALFGGYFLAPGRTNLLIVGLDAREGEGNLGRTDTNILVSVDPMRGYVGLLSIPRDLWVSIPGYGENRINTAHFFAEADRPGSGPQAVMETVELNFGVPIDYFARIRFEGLQQVVEALGGVEISLESPQAGLTAGRHRLDGEQSLAFVRERQGSDDFFRMGRAQIFLRGAFRTLLSPENWPRLPEVLRAMPELVETDIPFWRWPRLGLAALRAGPDGIESRTLSREMVRPFTTPGGAAVLAPDWSKINPLLEEIFGTET